MSTVMTSKTIMRCILMKRFTTKRNQRLNMLFKNQISMEQSTIDKIWVSFMVIISKCKIIVKPSQRESLNIHLHPILADMRKKFITLSLKRSLNNLKTSFRPERVHQSGKFIQLRDANPTVDASTRNLFQMLHLSGSINLERNWKTRLTADLKGTDLRTEPEWLTLKQCTKMPTLSKFHRSLKWSLTWMQGLWTNAWPSAPQEWASTLHQPLREHVDMMSKLANSLSMKTLARLFTTTTMQRTISSTCKTQSKPWSMTHISISRTKMTKIPRIKVKLKLNN